MRLLLLLQSQLSLTSQVRRMYRSHHLMKRWLLRVVMNRRRYLRKSILLRGVTCRNRQLKKFWKHSHHKQ